MTTTISVWEEHLFWIEILHDHAIFVRDHLSVEEEEEITIANRFAQSFISLENNLRQINTALDYTALELIAFAKQAYSLRCL